VATEREIALLCGGKEGKDGQGKKVVFLYLLKRGQQELCRPLVRLQRLASSVRRMAGVPLSPLSKSNPQWEFPVAAEHVARSEDKAEFCTREFFL
jgi:hypothetical protein